MIRPSHFETLENASTSEVSVSDSSPPSKSSGLPRALPKWKGTNDHPVRREELPRPAGLVFKAPWAKDDTFDFAYVGPEERRDEASGVPGLRGS